jgi:hypothetical protein
MDDSLLYSEFVIVIFVPLLSVVHLFGDLLLFVPMTVTLMWLVAADVTANLMWFESAPIVAAPMLTQFDPHVLSKF